MDSSGTKLMSEERRGSSRPKNLLIATLSLAMIAAGAVITVADSPRNSSQESPGDTAGESDLSKPITKLASFSTNSASPKQKSRRVRLFKPQQNGMGMPPGNPPNQNNAPNSATNRNTIPGYTGGVSNQRAGVLPNGPTTAATTERDKRDWRPMNYRNTDPSSQRIAQNNAAANAQNASLRRQQPQSQQPQSQQPLGSTPNFGRTPGNTFGVSFPQNNQQSQTNAQPNSQAEQDAALAARAKLLEQQQDEKAKALRYQMWQEEQEKLRQQQLFAKSQGGNQTQVGSQANANNPFANGQNAASQSSANANSSNPFDSKLWNLNNTTASNQQNQNPFATIQPANVNANTGLQNQGFQNAFSNSMQLPGNNLIPGGAQTLNVSATTPQTTIGQPQANSQSRPDAASSPNRRDVDERLSPDQIARLPMTAWSYDRWGNPVTKGGRVLDQFGREVSEAEAFRLTWGREQRPNPAGGPFASGVVGAPNGQATQNPNSERPQPNQVAARPVSSPSDASPNRNDDFTRDDERRRSAGVALQPKSRSVSAQLFFNTLLLVSIIGNIYLAVWFQRTWGRYRDLVASQRALTGPAVAD